MNKFSMTLAAAAIASVVSACSNNALTNVEQQPSINLGQAQLDPMVAEILATDVDQLWSQDFDHYQAGLLKAVANAISVEALKGDLNNENLEKQWRMSQEAPVNMMNIYKIHPCSYLGNRED